MTTTAAPDVLAHVVVRLSQIAIAAQVQRPVVTTWRRRFAGTATPFPDPVPGTDLEFRASDVADWLETTAHGNNPDVRRDLALHGQLTIDGVADEALAAAVEALLAVKARTGETLAALTRLELLDLADDVDPDDACCFSEIEALGSAGVAAAFVDILADAAFDAPTALETILGRSPAAAPPADAVVDVVARLALALAGWEPGSSVELADPHPRDGHLLARVQHVVGDLEEPRAWLGPALDSIAERRLRRRLLAQGWRLAAADDDATPAQAIIVTDLTGAGSDEEILRRADDVALSLHPGQRAVLVARASAFVDAPSSRHAELRRADLLRTDRIRTVIRLSAGLVPSRAREHLAIWVLADPEDGTPPAERWTTVADVSHVEATPATLGSAVVGDLLTDVLAAVAGRDAVHRHTFRFAQFVQTRFLLAQSGDLVLAARPPVRGGTRASTDPAAVAAQLVRETASPEEKQLAVGIGSGVGEASSRARLGSLVSSGLARVVPGNRVPDDVASSDADGYRLIGAAELADDAAPRRAVDRLALERDHPGVRLTEPGDVVFTTSPRPMALVDYEGLSVVCAPSRVLRLSGETAGLLPEVIAGVIRALPAGAKRWRMWDVPLVPADQAAPLTAALAAVRTRRETTRARLATLDALEAALLTGVSDGAVMLTPDEAADDAVSPVP
ncbi:conserved hypothetical protein [Beutenbergia cavernae DSM 12333]|uniref:Uncharacterized protein n=1 Tax=Beutenbergia cavernae (strain ATCC BAA-8 / DSM 12333 / CCUG 43141 / JCM 11478 / NBRC 16432 / NCIMB 13614 / HKI 0122) TaxID=471853 RepID=C5C4N3_BEUC1|nr:hypothetical protein [Beutenbergia cavernae]ACQ82157.1 conserved hypothetical protein [Beutenbergia cavernae DSM 12333]